MLKVIVNVCPSDKIKEIAGDSGIILTDADLYKILNEEVRFGSFKYSNVNIENLTDAIVEESHHKDIVIHTFNPGFLNWFVDDVAVSSFYLINDKGEDELLFSYKALLEKLSFMGPGEVVVDTDFGNFSYVEKV